MDKLPDWITAVSTAVTALAAIVAGIIAWLAYHREGRARLPIFEVSHDWDKREDGPPRHLFQVVVRNLMYESITVETVRILKPATATLAREVYNGRGGTNVLDSDDREQNL